MFRVAMKRSVRYCSTASEKKEEFKPGFFSRHPGLVFGTIVAGIAGYIYRGTRQRRNFETVQNSIVDTAVIAPYEAYELRSSNSITYVLFYISLSLVLILIFRYKEFATILSEMKSAFPSGRATFHEYDARLGRVLDQVCPEGIKNGYHLERVLLNLPQDEEKRSNVDAMTTALSMAVKGTTDERLLCLFGLLSTEIDGQQVISREKLDILLEYLFASYQIPSEKRVVPILDEKYPFQKYEQAKPQQLVSQAVEARIAAEKMPSNFESRDTMFTFEEFSALLKSKQICIWGECFATGSKRRLKN